MDAEPCLLRHRINEARERRLAAQREVDAAAEIVARDARRRDAGDAARQGRRVEAGAVDEHAAGKAHGFGAADLEHEAVLSQRTAFDGGAEDDHRAGRLGLALIGQHEGMAVDDAGRGREKAAQRGEGRLQAPQLAGIERHEVLDAVRGGARPNAVQERQLLLGTGDDQLAEALVRHAMRRAIGIEAALALDAGQRLEAVLRIVDPGMDHLAVARGGLEADAVFALEHHDFDAGLRQRPRDGEPDDPGPDDDAFDRSFGHEALYPP